MHQLVAACPPPCVVCTQDVTLCHQLSYILAAPTTTRVLIVTDGRLSSIEHANLSLLSDLTLLSLSRNAIEGVQHDALHGLTKLRTLLLGQNRISSSALADHTFSGLHSLQVLVLSNNALHTLRGAWFRNTGALTRLQVDGNQIRNLTASSFGGTDLHRLRHLDLSNNFISYIEKDAFRPLPQLQEVDLSRNRLTHVPDVFTPLKQLSLLNLDKNRWSCTCDLQPLAHFLRNYIKSSAHTLRNTVDIHCQRSFPSAAIKSVLRLSETNCDSKAPNLTLVLKDRRPLPPGPDGTLLTVLGFAGAVVLTCLGLVAFNWKLRQGKANEHTSENHCCRTFNESLCGHEARNHHAKGYCNCHLTQENEIQVTSIVGLGKEMPLLRENSHQAALASESTALDKSFRNPKGKDHGGDGAFLCLDSRLLQSGCSEPPGKRAAFPDAGLITRYCPKSIEKLRSLQHGEGQSQTLPGLLRRTTDIGSDTFRRRYAISASALARESLEKHLTNESWQPPIEKEDNGLQPHRQRHFITSSTSKPSEDEEHHIQKTLYKYRSKYDDAYRLLKQNKTQYVQPNNGLSCKYVLFDQFQDYRKEMKLNCSKPSKCEKEQSQINSAIEKFLKNDDNIELSKLSTKVKKTYPPKKINLYDPDLVGQKKLVIMPKTSTHWQPQESHSNQLIKLDLKKCSSYGHRNKGGKWLSDSQVLKKKRIKQSDLKGKTKGQSLRLKLSSHPFRKVRVHPENSLPEFPMKHKQVSVPPKKLPKTSEKKTKANLVSSADFLQQPESSNCVKLTSKRLLCKHASKQTPSYRRNSRSAPPLGTKMSAGNQSSVRHDYHPPGLFPDVQVPILHQPATGDAEDSLSHSQFSTEPRKGVTQLQQEAPGYLSNTLENARNHTLSSQPSSGIGGNRAMEPTAQVEQNKSKASELNLNHSSLSSGSQTQILGVYKTDTYTEEHSLDQNQILQHKEQNSDYKQVENETKSSMTKSKVSYPLLESSMVDQKGTDVGTSLPLTKIYDSPLISKTQFKNNLPSIMTDSIPYQNTIELPKEIGTSPFGGQATWHLISSSEKDIDKPNTLPREDDTEDLETKIIEREEENILDEGKTNSSTLIWTTQITPKDNTKENQQTGENKKCEEPVLCDLSPVEEAATLEDLSIASFHEARNGLLHSGTCPDTNSNMHDLKET